MHNLTSGSTSERSRLYNDRVIIQCIRHWREVSRAELARLTSLSAQTVSVIVSRLLKGGLIRESGRRYGARGQPSVKLTLNPQGAYAVGISVDRDRIATAVLDFCGNMLETRGHDLSWPSLARAVDTVAGDVGYYLGNPAVQADRVKGLGVALPSNMGAWQEELGFNPDAERNWGSHELHGALRERTGLPVWIENDGTAAALGERFFGVGQRFENFVYIYLGLALGGGVIIGGECLRGDHGNAADLGALPITDPTGQPCGLLMGRVSLAALYRQLRRQGHPCAHPRDVDAVHATDPEPVNQWLSMAGDALSAPLLSLIATLDPGALVFGGRLSAPLYERLIATAAERVKRYLPKGERLPEFLRSAVGADVGVVGAGILPLYESFAPLRDVLLVNRGTGP